ncbi:MAG: hypothetical protein LRZ85_07540 [Alphaproteobacteria bacterium]|nr:hypothetical protein [Alphaproteobacteria bacterium]MCD8520561.1 hypothetical protein [Alphaproteobacteria bacterium]MCD8571239.1 hypothetical protein [Alphaproteobacteria bacterium]
MLTGFEASMGAAVSWPPEVAYCLNNWKEPDREQTPEEAQKTRAFLDIIYDLREQAEAGVLDTPAAKKKAIDRLTGLNDRSSSLGLGRRDCVDSQVARNLVYALIATVKPKQATPVSSDKAVLTGLLPNEFEIG